MMKNVCSVILLNAILLLWGEVKNSAIRRV